MECAVGRRHCYKCCGFESHWRSCIIHGKDFKSSKTLLILLSRLASVLGQSFWCYLSFLISVPFLKFYSCHVEICKISNITVLIVCWHKSSKHTDIIIIYAYFQDFPENGTACWMPYYVIYAGIIISQHKYWTPVVANTITDYNTIDTMCYLRCNLDHPTCNSAFILSLGPPNMQSALQLVLTYQFASKENSSTLAL